MSVLAFLLLETVRAESNPTASPMPVVSARSSSRPRPEAAPGAPRPFLKWAGGKKQLLADFQRFYPPAGSFPGYHEPFLGSGAVFFDVQARLRPRRVWLSDTNHELVNAFSAVRDEVEALIVALGQHERAHLTGAAEHFYAVREQRPNDLSGSVARAARFIYLNKTCFNGLYRVNSRGQFNVPMGRYAKPSIFDPDVLRGASAALAEATLATSHFTAVLKRAKAGQFVYFDPPYVPLSDTAYFTAYTEGSFGEKDQRELADVYRQLHARGCRLMLSNSDTPIVHQLYSGFKIESVLARRNINARGDRRGHINEVVILNYDPAIGPR